VVIVANESHQLFPLAVETRAPLLMSSGTQARRRETMERDWARRRGILEDMLFAGSTTDSTSPHVTSSPTKAETITDGGNDVTTDYTTDTETETVIDDVTNDD
jgi:hypothetical protein